MKDTHMKYLFMLPFWTISIIACTPSPKSVQKAEEEIYTSQLETEHVKTVIITIEDNDGKGEEFFYVVEEMPQYPGGKKELQKFIKDNSLYPLARSEFNGENVVITRFFVTKDGNIKSPTVRGDLDLKYKKEALRIIKMMPKWKPGKHRGEAVDVVCDIPIAFKLQPDEKIEKAPESYTVDTEDVFLACEEMPEYPGGMEELAKFINKNINYPYPVTQDFPQGKVIVRFVVTKEGNVADSFIYWGIDPQLDIEILRVIKMMPKWKPGKEKGKTVNVNYALSVMFSIQ